MPGDTSCRKLTVVPGGCFMEELVGCSLYYKSRLGMESPHEAAWSSAPTCSGCCVSSLWEALKGLGTADLSELVASLPTWVYSPRFVFSFLQDKAPSFGEECDHG